MTEYRVVDCRSLIIQPQDMVIVADTPEQAAKLALGEVLERGSQRNKALRARVYWQADGRQTMVRLYTPVAKLG